MKTIRTEPHQGATVGELRLVLDSFSKTTNPVKNLGLLAKQFGEDYRTNLAILTPETALFLGSNCKFKLGDLQRIERCQ